MANLHPALLALEQLLSPVAQAQIINYFEGRYLDEVDGDEIDEHASMLDVIPSMTADRLAGHAALYESWAEDMLGIDDLAKLIAITTDQARQAVSMMDVHNLVVRAARQAITGTLVDALDETLQYIRTRLVTADAAKYWESPPLTDSQPRLSAFRNSHDNYDAIIARYRAEPAALVTGAEATKATTVKAIVGLVLGRVVA